MKPSHLKMIRLDYNENPLGASPFAIAAAQRALVNCHRYPNDQEIYAFQVKLSRRLGTSPENITLGNGSEYLLDLIAKTYLDHEDSAIVPKYCFLTIPKIIRNIGARSKVANNSLTTLSASSILETVEPTTKIIFIPNPNNPTGSYLNKIELIYLLNRLPKSIRIVIDEAYYEYVQAIDYPNTIDLCNNYANLIIVRTFSKIYGLAGLRLGYAISHTNIARDLSEVSLPFTTNIIALAAAQAALDDHEHIILSRVVNQKGLIQIKKGLNRLRLNSLPSSTNFICVDLKQTSLPFCKKLLSQGIGIRSLDDYGLPNYVRISIGTEAQNHCLLEAFYDILN